MNGNEIADSTDSVVSHTINTDSFPHGVHLVIENSRIKLPMDSLAVWVVNNTDSTYVTGELYAVESKKNETWTPLPVKKRDDGSEYAFNAIGYLVEAHKSRKFVIHDPFGFYALKRGEVYRIGKDVGPEGSAAHHFVYCPFFVD